MKQIRIYYKGKDILKYFFLVLVPLIWLLLFIGSKGWIEIKNPEIYGGIGFFLFVIGVLNYAKKFPQPKNVDLSRLKSTNDIRISLFKFKGFVNNGNNFSFIKIFFNENEVYLYLRNFLIKMYEGPLIIRTKSEENNYYYIANLEKVNKSEIKISIKSNGILPEYSFTLNNISLSDYNLIIKNFEKLIDKY